MSTSNTYERKYRVPSKEPEPSAVYLSDFDTEDIREYLRRKDTGTLNGPAGDPRGDNCGTDVLVIEADEISRIETLAVCGQLEHARAEALRIVSDHIGRPL